MTTPSDEAPAWLIQELEAIGVAPIKKEKTLAKHMPVDYTPWHPTKPGEEPPF